ncbi:MAG: hypothetical protein QW756_05060 [Nitrososphaerota archaeon]
MDEEFTLYLLGYHDVENLDAVRESLRRIGEMTENLLQHVSMDEEPLVDVRTWCRE